MLFRSVGDKVAGNFFQRWAAGAPGADTHQSAMGGTIDGMLLEYALLVALIALVAVGAVTAAGGTVSTVFQTIASSIPA